MNSITLTLPDSLYRQLESLAQTEGLSLNQYLLNAMTAHTAANYRVHTNSEAERLQQRAAFLAQLDRLGTVTEAEIDRVLAERAVIKPEIELDADTITKFQAMIDQARPSQRT